MKRRNFLKNLGLSIPTMALGKNVMSQHNEMNKWTYTYPEIRAIEDAITKNGEILIRIKFSGDSKTGQVINKGSIHIKNAELVEIKPFSFEKEDDIFSPVRNTFDTRTYENHPDIFIIKIRKASEKTQIILKNNNENIRFGLTDILHKGYLQFQQNNTQTDINFLLDKEIGEIELREIGIERNPDKFSFHIFADPQGGDPSVRSNEPTRMKIHNAFIEDSVILANRIPEKPLFTLIVGDIVDSQGEKENFEVMHNFLTRLKSPVLYELGNHETRYSSTFEPGYKMDAFHNYFAAQKRMNGMDKLLYSFNAGKWHFVVWPDPLRSFFWDNHPHYFDWLEKDLEKYRDRPTFVFQHVPCHPIGISPFQGYLDHVSVRKKFLDIITRHGNVKYVISGHVHIPVKSSEKVAYRIKGTRFINLPAAGYRPRAFGEQDYFGGPTQGIAIVRIDGENAEVVYKTVMEEEIKYSSKLPELDLELYKLWFNNKWEITPNDKIENGDFQHGLKGWIPEFLYKEDENPSVICETRTIDQTHALYLFNGIRDYQAPGQDRLPQTINKISQIINYKKGKTPLLKFNYKLDKDKCNPEGYCGGYLWIEGYEGSMRKFNLVYSAGMAFVSPIDKGINKINEVHHFELPASYHWNEVTINIKKDFEDADNGQSFNDLNIDRIVLNFGVWTLNEGQDQSFGFFINKVGLNYENTGYSGYSAVNDNKIGKKEEEKIWWRGKHVPFIHLAGEHRYHLESVNKTLFKNRDYRYR